MNEAIALLREALKEAPIDRSKAAAALCMFEEHSGEDLEIAYQKGWADRGALELEAHRNPEQLALRLGVCLGALFIYNKSNPNEAGALLAKIEASLREMRGAKIKCASCGEWTPLVEDGLDHICADCAKAAT